MGIPINDIALSNKPVAALISGINTLKFVKLTKIHEGFFVDMNFGVFMVDSTYSRPLMYGKQPIYFYDVRSAKPLDLLVMKELDEFVRSNGLSEIHEKHVKQGEKLRLLSLKHKGNEKTAFKELEDDETKIQKDVISVLDKINQGIDQENEALLKQGQPAIEISPDDYTNFVLERLSLKGLITREDAFTIKSKIGSGIMTMDEFARELENLHKIEINRPISTNAQNFLNHYRTFRPSDVLNYIIKALGLGKDIKDLGQPIIRNLVPIKYIILGCIGVGIMAIMLTSVDWGNVKNLIPFLK